MKSVKLADMQTWLDGEAGTQEQLYRIESAIKEIETAKALGFASLEACTPKPLTSIELDELASAARGYTASESAERRNYSIGAIKEQHTRIFRKLDVRNINQAVYKAFMEGMLPIDYHFEPIKDLSLREMKVLGSVVSGALVKETSQELGISISAVKLYRGRLVDKLGAVNIPHAIARAFEAGIFYPKGQEEVDDRLLQVYTLLAKAGYILKTIVASALVKEESPVISQNTNGSVKIKAD